MLNHTYEIWIQIYTVLNIIRVKSNTIELTVQLLVIPSRLTLCYFVSLSVFMSKCFLTLNGNFNFYQY